MSEPIRGFAERSRGSEQKSSLLCFLGCCGVQERFPSEVSAPMAPKTSAANAMGRPPRCWMREMTAMTPPMTPNRHPPTYSSRLQVESAKITKAENADRPAAVQAI